MKIVFITAEYPPESWGGIATLTKLYVDGLILIGCEIKIIVASSKRYWNHNYERANETINRYYSVNSVYEGHPVYGRDSERLKEIGYGLVDAYIVDLLSADLIICNNEELLYACQRIRSICPQVVLYYFCHGLQIEERPLDTEMQNMQRRLMYLSDKVLTASIHMKQTIRNLFPDLHTMYIPAPFSIYGDWYKKYISEERSGFVAAGRMVKQKGFDVLLSGYALSKSRNKQKLMIYTGHGNEEYYKDCTRIIEDYGLNTGIFRPWLDQNQMRRTLGMSACAVVCSRFEPLGMIVAESLLVGTPVIATRVGGIPELVNYPEYSEMMFCELNKYDLSKKLDWITDNSFLCRDIALRARESLLDSYSLERFRIVIERII